LEGLEAREGKKKRFEEHEAKMRKHIRKVSKQQQQQQQQPGHAAFIF
jgi:hypothetical protein